MAWFRIDDQLPKHRKARALLKASPSKRRDATPFGLWALAGAWSNDGFVPSDILDDWDDDWETSAKRLVEVGLWHPFTKEGEPGYVFHDWEDQNPTTVNDPSGAGKWGNHVRHHVNKGVTSDECVHCSRGDSQATSQASIAASRGDLARVSLPPVPPARPDPSSAPADADDATEETTDRFDEFWDTYGKKVGRKKAQQKWRLALKKPGVTADSIIAAANAYIARQLHAGKHPEFTKDPATWLNGEHWNDETSTNVHQLRPGDPLPPLPARDPWGTP